LKTLSGNDVYTNEKWSNPFDENGNLTVINCSSCNTTNTEDSSSIDTTTTDPINNQDSIFINFSWLDELVDDENCIGTSIHVFDQGAFSYLIIETSENTKMYFEDGQFYCQDSQNFSCQTAYQLGDPTYTWSCESDEDSQIDLDLKSMPNQKLSTKDEFNVYPNPSFGTFTINLPSTFSKASLTVFSMNGKWILTREIDSETESNLVSIDLQNQEPGMYILKFISDGQSYSKKLVLK